MGSETVVADAIARRLAAAGTRLAFGVPGGGSNLELVRACGDHGIDFVLCHAETSAAIMAGTYGELTGKPGLALATRGPGAVSAANGTAHATLDRAPMVVVTDAIAHQDRDRIKHQQIDHAAVFGAVAKASLEIGPECADERAGAAVELTGRPPWGPVHLDVVLDAISGQASTEPTPPRGPGPRGRTGLPDLWRELIGQAERPLLLVGVGARGSEAGLVELLRTTGVPALATYKAKGLVPEDLPGFAGLLTGAAIESDALLAADVLVAVGLDPVELIPTLWKATAPLLSLTPWTITDTYLPVTDEVVAAPTEHLAELGALLAGRAWVPPVRGRTLADRLTAKGMTPSTLVTRVRAAAPRGTIATVDAGAHMLVAMPLWTAYGPGEALISSGLATMGFALPAAIAAALCRPELRIVCLTGDGGLGMCMAELELLCRRNLDVLVVVFNDNTLSLIDIKQRQGRGGSAVTYRRTDFAAVAVAHGVPAHTVADLAQLDDALKVWEHGSGPLLLDVHIDPAEYPDVMGEVRGV